MRVDLHIHTTASDGTWSPQELIGNICRAGIALFSVTDHDTVNNIEVTQQLARLRHLHFIPGVEVSSTLKGRYFHIIGYGIDATCRELLDLLAYNTGLMEKADEDSIKKLSADGVGIDIIAYQAYRHNPARGGWKALSFLIDNGLCVTIDDFFTKFFTTERGISFPVFPEPQEVIKIIKKAGGIPVLAHPGSEFHGTVIEETLEFFRGVQIEGIECFHPSHTSETTEAAIHWCKKNKMLITGGSDCHGTFVPERKLGIPYITVDDLSLGNMIRKSKFV